MNPYESSVLPIILSCVGKIYVILESTQMEIVKKREGHNPAWMKALCIINSSVLPLNHHQETKDKSKCSAVKPKCYILILFCPKHFRLSAQLYIRLENPTQFGIFTPQCICTLASCLCWMS